MMGGHGGMMGCCGEAGMGMGMGMGMPMDCPMMKGTTAQPATKPAKLIAAPCLRGARNLAK